ncbi:MAG: secretin N-terminal domain-containing protein [Candidatus Sumerlaeia bacterium]
MKNMKRILLAVLCMVLLAVAIHAQEVAAPPEEEAPQSADAIRFNFRGASLNTVLDYLSEAAGVIVIRKVDVDGTVDAWSHQPLTRDEAIELVSRLLYENGYAAIHTNRTMTIVAKKDAAKRMIPVVTGSDPEGIPATEIVVTQIIPVKYADVEKLVDDLDKLLPDDAILSANQGSNALVLTATQSTIQRMTRIVKALDTSISEITKLRVFTLNHANATELAKVITDIFQARAQASGEDSRSRRIQRFFRGRGGPGGGDDDSAGPSEARAAQNLVVAVADERTNSMVVSAPEDLMPTIETLVQEIDTVAEDITEVRVFPLKYSDATEMAQTINDVFKTASSDSANQDNESRIPFFFRRGSDRGSRSSQSQTNERKVQQDEVKAVADVRTNSVVITAASEAMDQISQMIETLDSNPARQKKVHVYTLNNADVENVTEILTEMFGSESTSNLNRQYVPLRTTTNQQTLGAFGGTGGGGTRNR